MESHRQAKRPGAREQSLPSELLGGSSLLNAGRGPVVWGPSAPAGAEGKGCNGPNAKLGDRLAEAETCMLSGQPRMRPVR